MPQNNRPATTTPGGVVAGGVDLKNWWRSPYRVVQTNLRLIDARQDPGKIARDVRAFGADAIVSNVAGIAAFYPTDLELHWRNPYLNGDFVAAMIEAAHAEGLAYIGRFDLSKGLAAAYDAHPDWFMKNRTGEPRTYEGTYQACPNGGWAQDYGLEILKEGLSRYDVDGVFFNMSGFPPEDYSAVAHGSCVCDNCQRRFRELYGRELPKVDNFSDPAWPDYLEFQARTTEALSEKAYRLIKNLRPQAAVMGVNRFNELSRYETQRRYWRAAPEWAHQSAEQSLTLQARNPGNPVTSTSSAHIDYPWRQVLETDAYHLLRFAQQIATGSYLDLYLMGTLDDQDDRRFIPAVSGLFTWYGRNRAAYEGLQSAARVGLYKSSKTDRWAGVAESGCYSAGAWRGVYSALTDARVPFRMIYDKRVSDGSTTLSPADFDAIVLSNVLFLDEAEIAALDAYVEAGGLLISTGQTGAFAIDRSRRSEMPLASSPVALFGRPKSSHGWTFDAARAGLELGGARIPADGLYYQFTPRPGAEALLPQAPLQPFGPPEFSFAAPDAARPPETGMSSIRFGAGRSVHIPWLPEFQYYRDGLPDLRGMFSGILKHFAPRPQVRLIGNGPLEVTVQDQPKTGRRLIHVINYSGQRNTLYETPPSLVGLKLGLRGAVDGPVRALVADQILTASAPDSEGYAWIDLPAVGAFEAVSVSVLRQPA
jgi:hypothetical protein